MGQGSSACGEYLARGPAPSPPTRRDQLVYPPLPVDELTASGALAAQYVDNERGMGGGGQNNGNGPPEVMGRIC